MRLVQKYEKLFGTASSGICRLPLLRIFVGGTVYRLRVTEISSGTNLHAILGWGMRPSSRRSRVLAQKMRLPFWALEEGLLRSYAPGDRYPPLSLVVDETGIYYDSTHLSGLEIKLNKAIDLIAGKQDDFFNIKHLILTHSLSKYIHSPAQLIVNSHTSVNDRILVVDQTFGDMSVVLGGASCQTFSDMLAAAQAENPHSTIYVKTHPEVTSGRKGGYLTTVQSDGRIVVLRDAINPMSLLEQMDKVYVVTSTMGFEALLAGKPVVCFGVPWYAGWGVTDDRCTDSPAWARRTRRRSVDELFAAAYIHYTRYLDPVTHKRGTIMDVIYWLIRQKEMASRMHGEDRAGRVIGVGFRRWKAANLKPMLGLHPSQVLFASTVQAAKALSPSSGDSLVAWGATLPEGLSEMARDRGAKVLHVEDGFIRSVGLGSDLIRPQSLVLDERGIYFDATRPSDLEHLLSTRVFTEDDLTRSQIVREFIIEHGITKYNLEPRISIDWKADQRSVILVPGQVEDDASILLGCTTVRTNLGLLRATRAARPDAFIVYKPHPDVLSSNRKGKVALAEALQWADHIETGVSVVSCIDACDEVHTMTSLSGFDALLRGKRVVTYGQPFYAGWGLTEDMAQNPTAFTRRRRRLTLDELVAGALLHYPIYWDWDLKGYTTCEAVLNRIVEQRSALEVNGGLEKLRVGFLRRQWRKLDILVKSYLMH